MHRYQNIGVQLSSILSGKILMIETLGCGFLGLAIEQDLYYSGTTKRGV